MSHLMDAPQDLPPQLINEMLLERYVDKFNRLGLTEAGGGGSSKGAADSTRTGGAGASSGRRPGMGSLGGDGSTCQPGM